LGKLTARDERAVTLVSRHAWASRNGKSRRLELGPGDEISHHLEDARGGLVACRAGAAVVSLNRWRRTLRRAKRISKSASMKISTVSFAGINRDTNGRVGKVHLVASTVHLE
jgi:hypothetical protein